MRRLVTAWSAIVAASMMTLGVACSGPSTSPSELASPSGTVSIYRYMDGGVVAPDTGGEPFLNLLPIASPHAMDDVIGHEWGARIPAVAQAAGVARVEFFVGSVFLGAATDAPYTLDLEFYEPGLQTIVAIGLDAAGNELARDEAVVDITATTDESCHAMLDVLGIGYETISSLNGVDDPIYMDPYVNGVQFRYFSNTNPTRMRMDCPLAVRLYELTEIVKPTGVDEITHMGTYNYRCIGGVPLSDPDCRLSNHSFGLAIDIAGFTILSDETYYSINDDWIITEGPTCPGTPDGVADTRLHEYACAMWDQGVFQTILTPNYDMAHRNHFHVDTSGNFLKDLGSLLEFGPLLDGVDPEGAHHDH